MDQLYDGDIDFISKHAFFSENIGNNILFSKTVSLIVSLSFLVVGLLFYGCSTVIQKNLVKLSDKIGSKVNVFVSLRCSSRHIIDPVLFTFFIIKCRSQSLAILPWFVELYFSTICRHIPRDRMTVALFLIIYFIIK